MRAFKAAVLALAAIPLLTGALDFAIGAAAPRLIGATLSARDLADPLLNSQIRFFGGLWVGAGVLMVLSATDLARYGPVLDILFAALVVAGIGRAATVLQFGLPPNAAGQGFVLVTIGLEILVLPLMVLWRRRLAQPSRDGASVASP